MSFAYLYTRLLVVVDTVAWPVLRQLHWLVATDTRRQCVDFKVATFRLWHFAIVLSRRLDCRVVADARELRSTASRTYVVTRTYSTFGYRAFAAAGPGLWNSLPSHLKEAVEDCERWGHGAV